VESNTTISNDREQELLTMRRWKRWLPGLQVLSEYQAAWFPRDVMAGLVLATMLVPVGIAYALASGVPGIYGLYATIVPLLAYALFGPVAFLCSGRIRLWPP
jgi:MFS superfamily sulfate permease-like transporter